MDKQKPRVISIGYGRHFFTGPSIERARMEACAAKTRELAMIIFTRKRDAFPVTTVNDTLTLYPTNSRFAFLMPLDAFLIGRRLLKAEASAIITTQDPFETAFVGLLLKWFFSVSVVIQEHGDFFGHPYWKQESITNTLRSWWGAFALKKADSVRTVSKRAKVHLTSIGVQTVDVLPVAIDPVPFKSVCQNRDVALGEQERFFFLSVARFVPQKNLTLLLEAFALVYREHPQAKLVLVGEGEEKVVLEKRIARLFPHNNPVELRPWSNDIPQLMKEADAYVLSSNYEGWGRVLVEAMVAGLPVVTTAVGCADEVIKDGVHGRVVPVGDGVSLAAAMQELIADEVFFETCRRNTRRDAETIEGIDMPAYAEKWVTVLSH